MKVFAQFDNMYGGDSAQPTSPWTEAYQNTPAFQSSDETAPERAYDRDDQRPTHDALFLIYNQGY